VKLDAHGRCCGRKPIRYQRSHPPVMGPHFFCPRCDRTYALDGQQVANWMWYKLPNDPDFVRKY